MDSFYRLFVVPGMGHCAEGPGAWKFGQGAVYGRGTDGINQTDHNMMLSIVDWVENGNPPSVIIGANADGVEREYCIWGERVGLHIRPSGTTETETVDQMIKYVSWTSCPERMDARVMDFLGLAERNVRPPNLVCM